MTTPRTDKLTQSYYDAQESRILSNLNKIVARAPVSSGRIVPDASDLAIHDGRTLDASVMFLDNSKFSSRPSGTQQQQQGLLQILSLFFTEMIKVVEDYSGVVEKNTGDGLMAYFVNSGGVTAQTKAVACAMTMFYAASHVINPILAKSGIEEFKFRICIDHGPITIAKVGVVRGFNGIVAIGTTANIASKMLAVAEADEILLGSDVLQGLAADWISKFVIAKKTETGWHYTSTGDPYIFWKFTGRWAGPRS